MSSRHVRRMLREQDRGVGEPRPLSEEESEEEVDVGAGGGASPSERRAGFEALFDSSDEEELEEFDLPLPQERPKEDKTPRKKAQNARKAKSKGKKEDELGALARAIEEGKPLPVSLDDGGPEAPENAELAGWDAQLAVEERCGLNSLVE